MLHLLHLLAIVAEAMSGALMGMRRCMDRFGLCVVGTVTALGGGTVRDVLLGHDPLAWVSHQDYVLITIGAATVAAAGAKWLRDLLCNPIPHGSRKELYASIALGAGALYVALQACDVAPGPASLAVLASGFAVRMRAVRFRWQLKVFTAADSGGAG